MAHEQPYNAITTEGIDETCLEAARNVIDIDLALAGMQVAIAAITPDETVQYVAFGCPKELKALESDVKGYIANKKLAAQVRIDFPTIEHLQTTRANLLKTMDLFL